MPYTSEVFGVSPKINMYSYCDRSNLDGELSRLLRRDVISYDESIDSIFAVDLQFLFYRKHHTMQWPWEEMAEEARQQSLFDEDSEP